MSPDSNELTGENISPATTVDSTQVVVTEMPRIPVRGDPPLVVTKRDTGELSITLPPWVRQASVSLYIGINALMIGLMVLALIVFVIWFIGDLRSIPSLKVPAGIGPTTYDRNQAINAILNFLSNLVILLIFYEIFSAVNAFLRTRRPSMRPLLLIPLFAAARAVVVLIDQLLTNPNIGNDALIHLLAEMGAISIVGLFLSIALGSMRDRSERT